MLTYTGIHMMPDGDNAPAPLDLAVHMGRICQFGGSLWFPLLAHSVFVGELAWRERPVDGQPCPSHLEAWAWGLLHDAHEVITQDIPRGWKSADMKERQRELDKRIMRRYGDFGNRSTLESVDRIDKRATEIQCWGLGLQGYKEMEEAKGPVGAPRPTLNEQCMLEAITASPLCDPEECTDPHADVILMMADVFEPIQARDLSLARGYIEMMYKHLGIDVGLEAEGVQK